MWLAAGASPTLFLNEIDWMDNLKLPVELSQVVISPVGNSISLFS